MNESLAGTMKGDCAGHRQSMAAAIVFAVSLMTHGALANNQYQLTPIAQGWAPYMIPGYALRSDGTVVYSSFDAPTLTISLYSATNETDQTLLYAGLPESSTQNLTGVAVWAGGMGPYVDSAGDISFAGILDPNPSSFTTCPFVLPASSTTPVNVGPCTYLNAAGLAVQDTGVQSNLADNASMAWVQIVGEQFSPYCSLDEIYVNNLAAAGSSPAVVSGTYCLNLEIGAAGGGWAGYPFINNKGDVLFPWSANTSLTPHLDFYPANGQHDLVKNAALSKNLAGGFVSGNSTSFVTLNDADLAAAIVNQSTSAETLEALLLIDLGPRASTGGKVTVRTLASLDLGASGEINPGNGIPVINNAGEVIFWDPDVSYFDVLTKVDGSGFVQPVIAPGDTFTDVSGVTWSVDASQYYSTYLSVQAQNDLGSVAAPLTATALNGPNQGTSLPFLLRADPYPGVSAGSAIVPTGSGSKLTAVVFSQRLCNSIGQNPPSISTSWPFADKSCGPSYIGAPIAASYRFSVPTTSSPFAGVYIPTGLANGQDTFTVVYGSYRAKVKAGTPLSFLTDEPSGVSSFAIMGVDTNGAAATLPVGVVFVQPTAAKSIRVTVSIG
jgi:hypothetical protein